MALWQSVARPQSYYAVLYVWQEQVECTDITDLH